MKKIIIFCFSLLNFACINKTEKAPAPADSTIKPTAEVNQGKISVIEPLGDKAKDKTEIMMTPATAKQPKIINILALGDSYTIGEGIDTSERWPLQLADLLRKNEFTVNQPKIIATTGWTTKNLLEAVKQQNIQQKFELVYLLIGVNNQYQNLNQDNYRIEFRELLNISIGFAADNPANVIVISIPDWGVTPFAEGQDRKLIAEQINSFNQINFEEAKAKGVQYTNITQISRDAATDTTLIAADGLHPSGKMYKEWVNLLLKQSIKLLSK